MSSTQSSTSKILEEDQLIQKDVPVLVIAYNRPEFLKSMLIRLSSFPNVSISIAIDGPKASVSSDIGAVKKCIELAQEFKLQQPGTKILIRSENKGCYKGVTEALDWFFSFNQAGIILEDDLIVNLDFIDYMRDGLNRFYNNKEVATINGHTSFSMRNQLNDGYFTPIPSSWGWATWKDRWEMFNPSVYHFGLITHADKFIRVGGIVGYRRWWKTMSKLKNDELDSWAYRWMFTCISLGMRSWNSPRNLVSNVGFGKNATHTFTEREIDELEKAIPISLSYSVNYIEVNKMAMRELLRETFGVDTFLKSLRKSISRVKLNIKWK